MNSSNLIKRKILVENQIVNKIFVQKFKLLYFPRVNSTKKMILLMIEQKHFSIFTCSTLSEKDCGLIIKILDETYNLFDIDKLGWYDKYTVEIKKCQMDKNIIKTNFIYFHPDRKFSPFLCFKCII